MKTKIQWNKVTWYSKVVAVVIFVATFFLGFYLGIQSERANNYCPNRGFSDSGMMQRGRVFPMHNPNGAPQQIGGQKDEHGCLIGAGYSWCEAKNKCLRVWEEDCK